MLRSCSLILLVLLAINSPVQAADPVPAEASPTPTVPATLVPLPNQSEINASQEATEGSVLPGEPLLIPPEPTTPPDATGGMNVQALPTDRNIDAGPSMAGLVRLQMKFRQAWTEMSLRPEIAELKTRAFASSTEREKRELLRAYYQAIQAAITKSHPDLAINAAAWGEMRFMEFNRVRTEPGTSDSQKAAEIIARRKKLVEQMKQAAKSH